MEEEVLQPTTCPLWNKPRAFLADWESELVAEWRTGRRLVNKDGQDLGCLKETGIVSGRGRRGPGATGLCSLVCWTWDVALGARETAPSDGRVRGNGSIATSGRISGLTIVRYATPSECWEQV